MMRTIVATIALLGLATAAGAQTLSGDANWQLVSQTSTGAKWYLNKQSVRAASTSARTYSFWMRADNPQTQAVRNTMVQLKLTCGKNTYVPLHTLDYDSARKIVRDVLKGDSASNYGAIPPGSSVDAAGRWVCA